MMHRLSLSIHKKKKNDGHFSKVLNLKYMSHIQPNLQYTEIVLQEIQKIQMKYLFNFLVNI